MIHAILFAAFLHSSVSAAFNGGYNARQMGIGPEVPNENEKRDPSREYSGHDVSPSRRKLTRRNIHNSHNSQYHSGHQTHRGDNHGISDLTKSMYPEFFSDKPLPPSYTKITKSPTKTPTPSPTTPIPTPSPTPEPTRHVWMEKPGTAHEYEVPSDANCRSDVARLCGKVKETCLGAQCTSICLSDHAPELSELCQLVHPCFKDIDKLCKDKDVGENEIVPCLHKNHHQVSERCKAYHPCIENRGKDACDQKHMIFTNDMSELLNPLHTSGDHPPRPTSQMSITTGGRLDGGREVIKDPKLRAELNHEAVKVVNDMDVLAKEVADQDTPDMKKKAKDYFEPIAKTAEVVLDALEEKQSDIDAAAAADPFATKKSDDMNSEEEKAIRIVEGAQALEKMALQDDGTGLTGNPTKRRWGQEARKLEEDLEKLETQGRKILLREKEMEGKTDVTSFKKFFKGVDRYTDELLGPIFGAPDTEEVWVDSVAGRGLVKKSQEVEQQVEEAKKREEEDKAHAKAQEEKLKQTQKAKAAALAAKEAKLEKLREQEKAAQKKQEELKIELEAEKVRLEKMQKAAEEKRKEEFKEVMNLEQQKEKEEEHEKNKARETAVAAARDASNKAAAEKAKVAVERRKKLEQEMAHAQEQLRQQKDLAKRQAVEWKKKLQIRAKERVNLEKVAADLRERENAQEDEAATHWRKLELAGLWIGFSFIIFVCVVVQVTGNASKDSVFSKMIELKKMAGGTVGKVESRDPENLVDEFHAKLNDDFDGR